jgi:hypothetical protein
MLTLVHGRHGGATGAHFTAPCGGYWRPRELGATDTFNAGSASCIADLRAATNGGVDFAFEMAGSVRAMELAYAVTRRGGTTVTAGLPPPTANFSFPQVNLVAEERTIKGSYVGTCVPIRDVPRYIALYQQDRLLSARLKLEQINEGCDNWVRWDDLKPEGLFVPVPEPWMSERLKLELAEMEERLAAELQSGSGPRNALIPTPGRRALTAEREDVT